MVETSVIEVDFKIIEVSSGKIVHQKRFRFGEVVNETLEDFTKRITECLADLRRRYPRPEYEESVRVGDTITRRVEELLGLTRW